VFRPQLGAIALIAAFALPLAASAQTAPGPAAPAAAAPAMAAPGAPAMLPKHHRHGGDRFVRALARVKLTPGQKRQIAALLTPAQQAQLRAALARHRPAQ